LGPGGKASFRKIRETQVRVILKKKKDTEKDLPTNQRPLRGNGKDNQRSTTRGRLSSHEVGDSEGRIGN